MNIYQFSDQNKDLVTGYRLAVTLQPRVPLALLRRHGELRATIPEEDKTTSSPYFLWLPQVSREFDFLDRGASMASSVGPVPTDGGDFLPYLIRIKEIAERLKNPVLSEFTELDLRMAEIRQLRAGFGYEYDEKFMLSARSAPGPAGDYLSMLSSGDPDWLFEFVLSSLSPYPFDGLLRGHIQELRELGYRSLLEILNAPPDVLLALKGIGPKKLEKIKGNLSKNRRE